MSEDFSSILSSYHVDLGGEEMAINGVPVSKVLAASPASPLYIYNEATLHGQIHELERVLKSLRKDSFKIYFAMKANRSPLVLRSLRRISSVGIDTCSPNEVRLALSSGWTKEEISFTGSMLSNKDMSDLASAGVHVTLDNLSAVRRYSNYAPAGTKIGLRVDPQASGIGYMSNPIFEYSSSKLGILAEDFEEVVRTAVSLGLVVDTIHFHSGWGMQMKDAPSFARILTVVTSLADRFPSIETLNVGGGLTVPYTAQDSPLPCEIWRDLLQAGLQSHPNIRHVVCEIGTFICAPAGCLVCEVNTVNKKGHTTWIGVDAGFPTILLYYHYSIPLQVFRVRAPMETPTFAVSIASHINEAKDGFGNDVRLPQIEEGDNIVLFPAGAYGSAMASHHCMRGEFGEAMVRSDGTVEVE